MMTTTPQVTAEVVKAQLNYRKFYGAHVKRLQEKSDSEATGLCLFHSDHSPSLSVNLTTRLFKCHACGAGGDVIEFQQRLSGADFRTALEQLALDAGITESSVGRVVATFQYLDATGKVLYSKERIEPGRDGRRKGFRFFHVDESGKRQSGRGCDPVLYRLQEVLRAKALFIVEGEAKADLLASWGLHATCLDSGANSKLCEAMIQQLSGKRIAILLDNDESGREYAHRLAAALAGKVEMLKMRELPGLAVKQDVIDWAKIPGNDKTRLLELIKGAPEWMPGPGEPAETGPQVTGLFLSVPQLMSASLPEREEVLTGIRRGEVAQLVSVTNVGKSTILLNTVLALLSESSFPPLVTDQHKAVKVLYVDCESTASVLRHDIAVMRQSRSSGGIDANLLLWVDGGIGGEPLSLDCSDHLARLKRIVPDNGVGLVVIDTVSSAFSVRNENDNSEVKARIMGPLANLARERNCAVMFAHHHGKPSETGGEKAYFGRGASAFGALSRAVFTLRRDLAKGEDYVILECAKIKGLKFEPVLLWLNRQTRWFELQQQKPSQENTTLTVEEIGVWADGAGRFRTQDYLTAFKGKGSERILKQRLEEARSLRLIQKVSHGVYESAKCSAYSELHNCTFGKNDSSEQVEVEL